jgi:hypothetical protein
MSASPVAGIKDNIQEVEGLESNPSHPDLAPETWTWTDTSNTYTFDRTFDFCPLTFDLRSHHRARSAR